MLTITENIATIAAHWLTRFERALAEPGGYYLIQVLERRDDDT